MSTFKYFKREGRMKDGKVARMRYKAFVKPRVPCNQRWLGSNSVSYIYFTKQDRNVAKMQTTAPQYRKY